MTTVQKTIFLILLSTFYFLLSDSVFASQMFFETKAAQVQIGKKFEVRILINTEQESVNAFEGKIVFSNDILDLKEIRDGNTIVNFWLDNPRIATNKNTNSNEIQFSGIAPGGYNGDKGSLFSVIFQVKNEGEGFIEIHNPKVLLNDGKGTPVDVKVSNLQFVAIREPIRGDSWVPLKDTERPESFVPEIAKDETLFDGKWFVAFATQDKASGIDHYEILEYRKQDLGFREFIFKFFPKFYILYSKFWAKNVESPYVLQDQALRSFVWIKAVDKANNERIVEIAPRNPLAWYENYENWIILIVAGGAIYLGSRILWRKRKKI